MIPGQGSTPPNGQNAPNAWGMPNAYSSVIAALVQGANHQGPVTPEQIAAVQQWLIAKGRVQEVPNVALDPGNPEYVKILSEIQNQPEVAAPITPEEQTPPPPPPGPPGGAPGAMPVPGMGGEPGGQPMQPMSSFLPDIFADDRSLENKVMDLSKGGHQHCPQCMGELGMLHDGQYHCADCGYMGRHTQEGDQERIPALEGRTAADNVAPRCPKCDSATTGMVGDADNHARCHACKHMWKIEGINDMASGDSSITSRTAAPHPSQQANPMGVPAAEQDAPLNQGGNEDSSLTWEDTEGQAIRANQEYIMKNPEIPIPDIVRVLQVKPDSLHVELLGTVPGETNELSTDTHITKEETEMRHLTFEPLAQNADDRNNEPPPGEAQTPGYQNNPPSGQTTDEHQNSYPPSPVSSVTAQNENVCPHCGHKDFYSSMSSPVTVMHDCYRCGKSWETKEEMTGSDGDPGRFSWVMEDDDEEDWGVMQRRMGMRADAGTRSIGDIAAKDERLQMVREKLSHAKQERTERLAGKNFTPSEQRDLIDEDGIARNSDLLDLAGTHYEARDDWSGKHNAENVPDEHFAIGLLSDLT